MDRWRPDVLPADGKVKVTDDTFGADLRRTHYMRTISRDVARLFTEGWCWALAAVLADRNGWTVHGVGEHDWWHHVVVSSGPGMFADVHGIATENWAWGDTGDLWALTPAQILTLDDDSSTDPAEAMLAAHLLAPTVEELLAV